MTPVEWKRDTRQYASGSILYLGKWPVGGSHYDSGRSRNDLKKYRATCLLPGIKSEIGHFATDAEARQAVDGAVKYWLGELPSGLASDQSLGV